MNLLYCSSIHCNYFLINKKHCNHLCEDFIEEDITASLTKKYAVIIAKYRNIDRYSICESILVLLIWAHWDQTWIYCLSSVWKTCGTSAGSCFFPAGTVFSISHSCHCVWQTADSGSVCSPSLFPFLCSYMICCAILGC